MISQSAHNPSPEFADFRDTLAGAIYAGGDEPEWLTTADGSPNAGSYALADRVLAALPSSTEWRVLCQHGASYIRAGERAARIALDATGCPGARLQWRRVVAGIAESWSDA